METERNLLTTTEAAKYLGLKPSDLYKLMMRRAIPYYKPNGKQIYFDRVELEAWMKQNRVATRQESGQQAINYVITGKQKGGTL